jgi:Tol biopolymer transport system component
MTMAYYFRFLVFCLLILTGCGSPATVAVPTDSSVPPTRLNTPSATWTPDPTNTPTLIPHTLTSVPTSTETLAPTATQPPLPDSAKNWVIAYSSMENFEWQIYLIHADGNGKAKVTVDGGGGFEPNWSPDGKKIIFQQNGLKIVDLDSGETVRLPLKVQSDSLENEYLVKPSWSPDGKWIAFLNENGTEGDIYLVRPDGSGLKRLTASNDITRDGNLVWSPDGKLLAFSAQSKGNVEIFILDVQGALRGEAARQQLTDSRSFTRNLVTSWSPDGFRIAFSSDRDANAEVYMMNTDGTDVVRLTGDPASDMEPAWSPDGKLIAFTSNRDGESEIYFLEVVAAAVNPKDAPIWRLTRHKGDDVGPVWQPE